MKQMTLVVLLFAIVCLLAPGQEGKSAPPSMSPVPKSAICRQARGPMEMDGVLADWQDVDAREAIVIGEAENVQKPRRYKGPQDASALVYTKWDEKFLYFAAVVTDDFVRNTHVETELQEGDGILVCLSPKTPSEASAPKSGEPAPRYPYGFIITAGDEEKVKPQFMTITDANKNPLIPPGPWVEEVKRAAKRTRTGYVLEFCLPLSVMPDLKPAVKRSIGLEICLYESDTRIGPTKRTAILAWSSVKDRMDPREGGIITFQEAKSEPIAKPAGALRAEDMIKNSYTQRPGEYTARKPHDAFAASGLPFGLYFERAEREGIVKRLGQEPVQTLFKRLTAMCDSYLITWRPEQYELKDLSLSDAEMVCKVIQRLGFLYALTEEDEYADLARRTMLRVCERRANWSASLDTPERLFVAAELLRGLTVGSDWIHNALDLNERATVEETLTHAAERLLHAASRVKLSPAEKVVPLSAVGICGAATRKRNPAARDWMLAAEKAAAECGASGWSKDAEAFDTALFAVFTLAEPLKKAMGRDLFSVIDMRSAIALRAESLRQKVNSGYALDAVSARYAGRLHASVLLRAARENQDGLAMWLYQSVFTEIPASTRNADDVFAILWYDENVKLTAPTWYSQKSQAELVVQLEKRVKEFCLAEAAAREKARKNLRSTVKAQRALPVPFSAYWLSQLDEKQVLSDFQVVIKPELLKQHPRLFFTQRDIPILYARAASTMADIWPRFIAFMESNLGTQYRTLASFREQGSLGTGTGDTLAQFAFTYALTGDDAHGETVRRFVQGYCAEELWDPPYPDLVHAHVLAGLALAYDAAQACLMPEERLRVRDKLVLEARRMFKATCHPKRVRTPGSANNHSWIQKCGLAIAATAIYEHTPEAKAWLDRVRWEYQKILEVHGPDGASCEGASYWAYGLSWMLKYIELLWHTTGEDMYDHPWLRHTGYYALYCLTPGGALHVNFGDNSEEQGPVSLIPYRLASEFRDEYIQWLGELFQHNPNMKRSAGANIWSFLWRDPTVACKPPDDLPPYRYFDDLEMVVVKSSWKEDARMLAFRCGPPMGYSVFEHGASGYGHAHPDQTHFIFFAGGNRFIISDPGYSRWKMTNEHNVILADGIGQIGEEEHWLHYVYKPDELAEMQEVFLSPDYSYMRGEAHRAYRREAALTKVMREIVFLDGSYLIVHDSVAASAPRRFEWFLHSWNPIEGPKDNAFTLSQDDVRLTAYILGPEVFERKTGPMLVKSAVKWGLDGRPVYIQDPVQHGFYLSVWPKEKGTNAEFLTVLWSYKAGQEKEAPKCTRLSGQGYLGAAVDCGTVHDRIVFNASDRGIEAEGIATDASHGMVRLNQAFEPVAYIVHNGKVLACGACDLVQASAPVTLRVDATAGEGVIEAKEAAHVQVYVPRAAKTLLVNGVVSDFTYDARAKVAKFKVPKGRVGIRLQ